MRENRHEFLRLLDWRRCCGSQLLGFVAALCERRTVAVRKDRRSQTAATGLSRRSQASWSAVAERERRHRFRAGVALGDFHAARACESGVALRFPPQSKTRWPRTARSVLECARPLAVGRAQPPSGLRKCLGRPAAPTRHAEIR